MIREKFAKFILSDDSKIFVAYNPRSNENIIRKMRRRIENITGQKVKRTIRDYKLKGESS